MNRFNDEKSVQKGVVIMRRFKSIASTEFLLLCGVVGPPLFFVALLIEGATRPGYSAWRVAGSYLALSSQGWEQIANFVVCGLLCIAFAVGLQRTWRTGMASVWGPLLVGMFGLGLVIAGVFVTDPGWGYPPGAPTTGSEQTWHGWVHGINGLLLFLVVLPAACFVLARRFAEYPQDRRWAIYSRVTGALVLFISLPLGTLVVPILENAGLPVVDGLIQRVEIFIGWAWLALVAMHLWREARRAGSVRIAETSAAAN
jgi:Protein of unknown function (DUF998)